MTPTPPVVCDLIGWRAALAPQRRAVLWRGRWLTYAELDSRAGRLAARLAADGVRKGDRVAILAQNHLAHLDLVLTAPKLGFIYTPFNWRLAAAEQKQLAAQIAPALVLHDAAQRAVAQQLGAPLRDLDGYEAWLAGAPTAPRTAAAVGADDTHMILFTGGSTGLPKGALIPYRQVFFNAVNTAFAWGLSEDDCAIQATPAFHAALNVLATPLLYLGGRIVWPEAFEPGTYLRDAARERATILFLVPTMFQMLAEHADFAGADLSSVRFAISGGAPCPPTVRQAWSRRGLRFKQGYGMTECGVNCFALDLDEAQAHPDSVGRPMPLLDAVIRRADGRPAARGETGELTLAGPVVCAGYYGRADTDTFRDGWLWTGDLARQDEAGRYFIVGRRKEMYISGGENVYPAEVEAALARCAGVAECAVIGVPHPRWGETGLAAVVARPGARLTLEGLRAELKAQLAGYKLPGELLLLDALPRTGAGKIAKPEVRQLYESRQRGAA